jgi:hypothetical protein
LENEELGYLDVYQAVREPAENCLGVCIGAEKTSLSEVDEQNLDSKRLS